MRTRRYSSLVWFSAVLISAQLLLPGSVGLAQEKRLFIPAVSVAIIPEAELNVIALPRNWCNYGALIDGFERKYGVNVNELNPDAGSADELQAIRDNKGGGPAAPDVIDVGLAFADGAKAEGLIQPYKVGTWDTIPAGVKDEAGYWYGGYYGVMAFMVNEDAISAPGSWADLLTPAYRAAVALSGDPRTSSQGAGAVQAASLAYTGTVQNPMPGLNYFASLYAGGSLIPVVANNATVFTGETPVRLAWDYNALNGADAAAGSPPIGVIIPSDGQLASVYVQAISAYAPHPNSARLWMEYLFSDEGQLLWMQGNCRPARIADLRARGVVPQPLLDKMPPANNVVFPTSRQMADGRAVVAAQWDAVVGADIKAQ